MSVRLSRFLERPEDAEKALLGERRWATSMLGMGMLGMGIMTLIVPE